MIEISTPQARQVRDFVGSLPGVLSINLYGDRLHIALRERGVASGILDQVKTRGFLVDAQREILPSLEDAFIAMVQGQEGG